MDEAKKLIVLEQENEELKQKQELTAGDVKSKQAEIEDVNILI